jgi:hypothetical protein
MRKFTLLLVSILAYSACFCQSMTKAQTDSIDKRFLDVTKISLCGKSLYNIADNQPPMKALVNEALGKIDLSKLGDDYDNLPLLSCEINCDGKIGNWKIAAGSQNSTTYFWFLNEILNAVSSIKQTQPLTSGGKAIDYNVDYFPLTIKGEKLVAKLFN